jgi:4-diphosphocytidyl-2C-methyl-D-erythritol kinase
LPGWDEGSHGRRSEQIAQRPEPAAIALHPAIGDVLAELAATPAACWRMSGSGATCFALYGDAAVGRRRSDTCGPDRWCWAGRCEAADRGFTLCGATIHA